MNDEINNIVCWIKKSLGYYRYVIGANAAYELLINKWYHNTDILDATASLYIVGSWHNNTTNENYIEREQLYTGTVKECLLFAAKDNEENSI